ncbi:MAG: hypothetical protein ABEH47_00890 [Haloferacaceae archaeon]
MDVVPRQAGEDAIYERTAGWVDDVTERSGTVRVGRERLFTGAFEDDTVDGQRAAGALWRFGTGETTRTTASREGAIRLTARPENARRSVLSPGSRLPVGSDRLDVSCRYRYAGDGGLSLLVTWYNAGDGISIARERVELEETGDEWNRVTRAFAPPTEATRVNLFVYLEPPSGDDPRRADVDDLRLVEWAPADRTGGREFDHVLVSGGATLELRGEGTPPAEWRRVTTD